MPYRTISNLMTSDVAGLSRYIVDDLEGHLQCGQTSTILLLESPHVSEVIEGYPSIATASETWLKHAASGRG